MDHGSPAGRHRPTQHGRSRRRRVVRLVMAALGLEFSLFSTGRIRRNKTSHPIPSLNSNLAFQPEKPARGVSKCKTTTFAQPRLALLKFKLYVVWLTIVVEYQFIDGKGAVCCRSPFHMHIPGR